MKRNDRTFILIGVMLAMLLSSLDQTIVSTAMPQIVGQLHGLSRLSWVFTAYMLTSTITVPIYGKLTDIFGRRGLYIAAILVFLAGSALSGMAQSMTQLILFRGLQGIGAGGMMVNSMALIGDIFPPAERGKYQGMLQAVFGLSSIGGPLLGGWITDSYSWRWIFYINIPVGAMAIAVLLAALPKLPRNASRPAIDFAGAALIASGLVPLLLALVWGGSQYAWDSWEIILLLAGAGVILFTFGIVERRAKAPVLSLDLFKNRVFSVSVAALFLTSMGMFGAIMYIPLFAQGVVGVSATNSGLVMIPMMASLIVTSTVGGLLITRTGKYKAITVVGMVLITAGMFVFSNIGAGTTSGGLGWRMVVLGGGLGVVMPVFTLVVQSAFGVERLGEVTAGSQLFRSIGATVGTAVLGGIMNTQLAVRLVDVGSEPFVVTVKQMGSALPIEKIDGNTIQGLLGPAGQSSMRDMISKAPAAYQATLSSGFDHLLNTVRVAFSGSIDRLFLIGGIIMLGALVMTLFLPEIPLRKTNERGGEKGK